MPEPKNNTPGERRVSKAILDDYLPDYSPRPKYVIATIYPPAGDPLAAPEQEVVDRNGIGGTGWREASLGEASSQAAGSGSESAGPLNAAGAIGTTGHLSEPSPFGEPSDRELYRMELPRGKFHSLERNTSISSLLHHLHTREFQGTCKINRGGSKILLVFDQGRIILAEYGNLVGDAALGMICTHRLDRVDALISDLDDAQIRLSLEFNPSGKVRGNQEPSWVVSPATMEIPGIHPGKQESGSGHLLLETSGSGQQTLLPGIGGPSDETGGSADEQIPAGELGGRPEEAGDRSDMPVRDEAEKTDWKKALDLPLCPSSDDPVLTHQPGPDESQLREKEIDRRAALTATPVSPPYREVTGMSVPEHHGKETAFIEGWKKALYMPVESAQPEYRDRSPAITVIPGFELLSADSELFDDIPVKRKLVKASGPDPAEQWRSMGINRVENSSV